MEKSFSGRAQNKIEDLNENLVKPMRYNYVEFILAGKNLVKPKRYNYVEFILAGKKSRQFTTA